MENIKKHPHDDDQQFQNVEDLPVDETDMEGTGSYTDDDLDAGEEIGSKGGGKSVEDDYAGDLGQGDDDADGLPDLGIDDPYWNKNDPDVARYNINREWGSYGSEAEDDLDY